MHRLMAFHFTLNYSVKDLVGVVVFLALFFAAVFFAPEMGGYFIEAPNFEPANPLKTPTHIAPVWYFTPYYAILRAVPSFVGTQVWGVLAMGGAIVVMFFLPWLDQSPIKSIRYKGPTTKIAIAIFVVTFIVLGWLGTQPATASLTLMAQFFTLVYFLFYFLMPSYSRARGHATSGKSALFWFIVSAVMTVGTLIYWWTTTVSTDGSLATMVSVYSVLVLLILFTLGIKPLFIKPDAIKAIPERVTK